MILLGPGHSFHWHPNCCGKDVSRFRWWWRVGPCCSAIQLRGESHHTPRGINVAVFVFSLSLYSCYLLFILCNIIYLIKFFCILFLKSFLNISGTHVHVLPLWCNISQWYKSFAISRTDYNYCPVQPIIIIIVYFEHCWRVLICNKEYKTLQYRIHYGSKHVGTIVVQWGARNDVHWINGPSLLLPDTATEKDVLYFFFGGFSKPSKSFQSKISIKISSNWTDLFGQFPCQVYIYKTTESIIK